MQNALGQRKKFQFKWKINQNRPSIKIAQSIAWKLTSGIKNVKGSKSGSRQNKPPLVAGHGEKYNVDSKNNMILLRLV